MSPVHNSNNPNPLSALLSHHLALPDRVEHYNYEDGIRLIRFAITANPDEPFLYFYLATFYSAAKQIGKSLYYYEEALRRGFNDWHKIVSDPSFENARNTKRFRTITVKYKSPV